MTTPAPTDDRYPDSWRPRGAPVFEPETEPEPQLQPLAMELQDFAHCMRTGDLPCSHGELGCAVVRTMEAAEESLRRGGEPVTLADDRRRVAA